MRANLKFLAGSTLVCLYMFFAVVSFGSHPLSAQTVTGQISGTVTDPTGAVVAGANVSLSYKLTKQTHATVTGASGDFVFTDLIPGTYDLVVTAPGFQTYRQSDITVSPSENVALHQLQLTVGSTTAEITVQANAAHVETESSEHSAEITADQFTAVPDRGRNFIDYLALLPGTVTVTQTDAPGSGSVGFNGGESQTLIQLDGVESQDIGATGGAGFLAPNIDAIEDVKVLTGAVPAEYGARANGSVTVVIRNGTREFHGSGYEFNRNDDYNANTYFNKLNHIVRQPYKYNNPGFTLGGPVIIPGINFNKSRDKLFFFFAGDFLSRNVPAGTAPTTTTVPTLAERAGNFSLTPAAEIQGISGGIRCPDGATPTNLSPLTCAGYPSSAAGTIMLGLFPNPTCNRTTANLPGSQDALANAPLTLPSCPSTANWIGTFVEGEPRHDYILRSDYNLAKNELLYVRLIKDFTGTSNLNGFLAGASWGQLPVNYDIRSQGAVITLVSTIHPNIVNEFVAGEDLAWQNVSPLSAAQFAKNVRANVGLGTAVLPTLYPTSQNNPLDLIPNASFGGGKFIGSAAPLSEDARYPFYSSTRSYNVTDNVSWVFGKHNTKFGIYYENSPRTEVPIGTTYNGAYSFSVSAFAGGQFANPLDTGYTYSNAYLGVFQTYTETSSRPLALIALKAVDWFAQDNWKLSRRLTLDYGIRFYKVPDPISRNNAPFGYFAPSDYNASAQPQFIYPGNPNYPASAVGLFLPGTGTPYQGMVVLGTAGLRHQVRNNPPIGVAPRVGFAWDVFGDGKTALRGGFGIFYDQENDETAESNFDIEPPEVVTPEVFNSTISSLTRAASLLGPVSVNTTPLNYQLPVSYQYNLGVQRDLGHNLLLDASYVGNVGRHGIRATTGGDQINAVPYGADFVPANVPLASHPNFLRPYLGYSSILLDGFSLNSNYNSLQVQINKRVGRLSAGGSYTWSKVLDDAGTGTRVLGVGVPLHRYYGPGSNDRRNNLTVNWTYELTKASVGPNLLTRQAFGGWNVQGLAQFTSGSPSALTGSFLYDVNGASASGNQGGPIALNLLSYPVLSSGQRTKPSAGQAPQYLNIASIGVPAGGPGTCTEAGGPTTCGLGNAPFKGAFYGPGINNWDISVFKNFALGKEASRQLQIRAETYNTFNHTQFSSVSSTLTILPGGVVAPVTAQNKTFGQFSGTQSARIMVLAAKIYF